MFRAPGRTSERWPQGGEALIDGCWKLSIQRPIWTRSDISGSTRKGYIETINCNIAICRTSTQKCSPEGIYAERNAINAPIQGSAADINGVAMIHIYQRWEEGIRSKMILQVRQIKLQRLAGRKRKIATNCDKRNGAAYQMKAPLRADHGWGHNWLEAH